MVTNYFRIAWRNLRKNKLFGALNILGLSVGLMVTLLLTLFIIQEQSFNSVPNRDHIFRYLAKLNYDGNEVTWAGVPNAVGPTVAENRPEVVRTARTILNDFGENANIVVSQQAFIEPKLYWCDPEIIDIFAVDLLHGDPASALAAPNSVILSASTARKFFGSENPVGKTIELNRTQSLTVKGVYADLPSTVSFDAELIGSYSSTGFHRRGNTWDNASFETWVQLEKPADRAKLEAYFPALLDQNVPKENQYFSLAMQPLDEVHLHSEGIDTYSDRKGSAGQLTQLSYLAMALLLMAAINYMNLATARAQQRSKEVGVSKTLGATRSGLVGKFYAETGVVTLIAIVIALLLAVMAIPLFNQLSGKTLEYQTLLHPVFLFGLPLVWLVLTLIAGFYPAMMLSSYAPMETLQKGMANRSGSAQFRKALVVVQFAASIVLIVGVLVMHRQLDYISQHNLGYNPENVMAIGLGSIKGQEEMDALRNEIGALPQTQATVISQAFPGRGESGRSLHKDDSDTQGTMLRSNRVIGDLQDVLQLNILAGRMIKERHPEDTLTEVVLNRYAVEYLGLAPEEAVGRRVQADLGNNTYIVGVVDNFNFASLHTPVAAYAFTNAPESIRYLMVRFTTGDLRETIRQYERAYKQAVPDSPFDYTFLDSQLQSRYREDQQASAVLLAFSILAIFIGCLGLFGLAAFTAEKRTKEIGVRKVLGASVTSVVKLLSADFVRLVLLAFVVASPIAYWLFSKWLDNFAYHIDIPWWVFAVAGLAAVLVALATVSWQAIRAAVANPVDSLRDE